jgi:preprotein translocase subunit Sss1
MNNDDYGYFGKGTEGYIHYKQAFDESFKRNKTATYRRAPQSKEIVPRTKEVNKTPKADRQFAASQMLGAGILIVGLIGFVAMVVQLICG